MKRVSFKNAWFSGNSDLGNLFFWPSHLEELVMEKGTKAQEFPLQAPKN